MDYRSPFRFSGRLYLLAGTGYCVMLLLLVKLAWIQLYHNEHYLEQSTRLYSSAQEIPAERGQLLDRNGVVLAAQIPGNFILTVQPDRLQTRPQVLARALAGLLNRPVQPLAVQLTVTDRQTVYVVSGLTLAERDAVSRLLADDFPADASCFSFEGSTQRCYPTGAASAQLVGYVNQKGNGVCGVEASLDSLLRGEPGLRIYGKNCAGQKFEWQQGRHKRPTPGATVTLTIDSRFQAILLEEMKQVAAEFGAQNATGLIMNPRTGELLAMGSWPTFNPNLGISSGETGLLRNRAVSDTYEPGSTFKTFTFAQLLAEYDLDLRDSVDCEHGSWQIGRWVINDSHPEGYGVIPATEVYYESSNIGTAKLAERIEARAMYAFVRSFGFGQYAGIDLPGEVKGRLQPLPNWRRVEKANISFGQGISVTPLQMAVAYAALFNGGRILRPYVIQSVSRDGKSRVTRPLVRREILSPRILVTLQELMQGAVLQGTGLPAAIPGLTVMGKTGTAQKIAPEGGYSNDDYIASFVGLVNIAGTPYLGLVLFDTPRESIWGGTVAGGSFKRIFSRIRHLNQAGTGSLQVVVKDLEQLHELPDCHGLDNRELRRRLRRAGVDNFSLQGTGTVIAQDPVPGLYAALPAVNFRLAEREFNDTLQVPDLAGLELRDAVALASQAGLTVNCCGSGRVARQLPPPGSRIDRRDVCQLVLR